jgi:catechol 2,3-dioxygenase-like lactoylglutathione lyase family enzyme
MMKRASLLMAAMLLCLIALDLRAKEQPLVTRVDHFYMESDQAHSLFTFFKETFQLPENWPFRDAGTHTSGGLWLGNTVLEFLALPQNEDKPVKTKFRGIAFEPTDGADEAAAELTRRGISHAEVENRMRQGPDGQMRVAWSLLHLKDFPPVEADVFFVDSKFRKSAAARHQALDDELTARNRGPLGIVGAVEITVGVQDLEEARRKWSRLLAPSPQISEDSFVFHTGPRIHLVRADSPGIQGIILKVISLSRAEKFLKGRGLLAKDDSGRVAISPAAIEGLSIRLIDDSQAEAPGHPLLGHGHGVDHVGIGVRDLEKAVRDYEKVLGFRCTEKNLPSTGSRALLRRLILFEDETLLEFLSPSPGAPAIGDEFREWVEKHEGGMSLALRISSAQDAAAYLEAHNFEVKVTGWPRATATEGNPAQVQYYSVTTPDTPSSNRQIFKVWIWLFENIDPERSAKLAVRREQGLMDHPNTAVRLHAAWFAVRNLEASLHNLQDMGLELGEAREAKFLGSGGREVKAGTGTMILLQSTNEKGALNKFLSDHDDGDIMAISIEVSDLNKARSWIEGHSRRTLEPYDGFYGRSILIPPDMTHGVWMELFQR